LPTAELLTKNNNQGGRMRSIAGLVTASLLAGGLPFVARGTDLVDAYQLSLDHDPRLQAARYRYEAAQEAVPQARALILPSLSVSAERLDTNQNIKSSDNTVYATGRTDFPTSSYGLVLSQPILRLADFQRLKQSHAEVAAALAEYTAAEQELVLRVAQSYLGVLAAQDNVRFTEAEKTAVERQRDLARARRASGLAPRSDEYDANARYALVVANAVDAQNKLDDALQALLESAGMLIMDVVPLRDDIPLERPDPLDVDQWVATAVEQNPEVLARERTLDVAEREVRRQAAARYPTLNFLARLDDRDTRGSLFGGGSDVGTSDFAIQLKVPLYMGGSNGANTREAGKRVGQRTEELKLQRLTVGRQARASYLGVLSGISRTQALDESLRAQRSALDAKQRGYASGINTGIDVLDAERDLYLTLRDHAQARYDYVLSTLRLKQAAGTLSAEDLMRVNRLLVESDSQ
jgi:outer membrane protein